MKRLFQFYFIGVLLLYAASASAETISYVVTDLGNLGLPGNTTAGGINNSGQVTGMSRLSNGNQNAFVYTNGVMTRLNTPGSSSGGIAINASGQVAGSFTSGHDQAFLYSNGVVTPLGTLGGLVSEGAGINTFGQLVGDSLLSATDQNGNELVAGFLYSNGVMSGFGGAYSAASAINDSGEITGEASASIEGTNHYAFLCVNATQCIDGDFTDLGTLGGANSVGAAINTAGQIAGSSQISDGQYNAFLYSNGQMIDLGTLGGVNSFGEGINASGQVVGESNIAGGALDAFMYSDGEMLDLNSLIDPNLDITLSQAVGINDLGQIVADGTNGAAYLLTPVSSPEPSTLAMLGTGFLLMVITRRVGPRRTKSSA